MKNIKKTDKKLDLKRMTIADLAKSQGGVPKCVTCSCYVSLNAE